MKAIFFDEHNPSGYEGEVLLIDNMITISFKHSGTHHIFTGTLKNELNLLKNSYDPSVVLIVDRHATEFFYISDYEKTYVEIREA